LLNNLVAIDQFLNFFAILTAWTEFSQKHFEQNNNHDSILQVIKPMKMKMTSRGRFIVGFGVVAALFCGVSSRPCVTEFILSASSDPPNDRKLPGPSHHLCGALTAALPTLASRPGGT